MVSTKNTLYLSGPMTGLPDFNYPAFNRAAQHLRSLGHAVFNPAEQFGGNQTLRKDQYMRVDLAAVRACDEVVLLPGWEGSEGALQEYWSAKLQGMPCTPYEDFPQPAPLIGLCGYARSGKDTVGEILLTQGFRRISFADKLKSLAGRYGWSGSKDEEGRSFLQDFGMAMRETLGEDVWVNAAFVDYDPMTPTVITDVRFTNEIEEVRRRGGVIWRVDRPGTTAANNHVSEHEWTSVEPEQVICNSGTIEDLRRGVLHTITTRQMIGGHHRGEIWKHLSTR